MISKAKKNISTKICNIILLIRLCSLYFIAELTFKGQVHAYTLRSNKKVDTARHLFLLKQKNSATSK